MFGKNIDYWIVLIHPDEFYIENLRYVINLAIKYNMELIVYNSLHNMPHIHDKQLYMITKDYNDLNYFIHNDKNTWKEDRIFKFKNDLIYTDTHSLVIPHKVNKQNSRIFHPNLLHYKIPYIDIKKYTDNKSLKTSCWSSLSTHFPPNYKISNVEDFFLSEPAGFYKGSKLYNKKNVLPDSLKII